MPTTSENLKVYIPLRKPIFEKNGKSAPIKTAFPMRVEQFLPFGVSPPPSYIKPTTPPQEIVTSMDDVKEIQSTKKKTKKLRKWLIPLIALPALAIIGTSIAVPLVLLQHTTTTSANLDATSSVAPTAVFTTTINCVSPYVLSSSGTCVNPLIDINNCGSVNFICPSNYTSCSAGTCSTAPSVELVNGDFIWTSGINGTVDDSMFHVTLPFNITLYTTTTDTVSVTTNGVLCLASCSTGYTETALPSSVFSGATVFSYWDDLFIYASTSQGIYYDTIGTAPNRTLIFEFYMSHFNQPNQYYHYQVLFFESRPGVVQNKYFQATDGGITCTIGVQASGTGPAIQYSFDVPNSVRSNMSLTFDTNLGTYVNSTF